MFVKKVNTVERHQSVSDNAFSVFQDTVNQLAAADADIKKDIEASEIKIEAARAERDSLVGISIKNSRLADKIKEFLE
tara:strand:- start:521 stop:754 length:234 start_codon:yes stop_codon:yes gene_type:complete